MTVPKSTQLRKMKTIEQKIKRAKKRILYWNKEISNIKNLNKHHEVKYKLFIRLTKYKNLHISKMRGLQRNVIET